jgi:hypothetical protein
MSLELSKEMKNELESQPIQMISLKQTKLSNFDSCLQQIGGQ